MAKKKAQRPASVLDVTNLGMRLRKRNEAIAVQGRESAYEEPTGEESYDFDGNRKVEVPVFRRNPKTGKRERVR